MINILKFLKKSVRIELIYTDEKGDKYSFDSEIVEIEEDKIFIKYPVSNSFSFDDVEIFERLNTVVYTQEGVLSNNVNYLSKEENGVYISFPYNNQFCQRRENTRIPMHIDFELTSVNVNCKIYNSETLKTKDISGKGLGCITKEPLPDFENAKIILHFQNTDIEVFGKKVYSRELVLNDETVYVNGIAFTEISTDDVKTILKNCMKFEIASRHNERLFESL